MTSQLGEFELIQRFFKTGSETALSKDSQSTVVLGIGDDCALLRPNPGEDIAITSDMLVEGRHFFEQANPQWLGRKALAVNLSDLAAMGAKPIAFTLAIALPEANVPWLTAFSAGLLSMAQQYDCPLIGGDTTAGPLTISITAFGSSPKGKALRRSGAKAGDDVWVSGTVGDARLTLAALRHELILPEADLHAIEARMHQPEPRIALGLALRDIASAALDVSDGLLGDLKHLLEHSQVDAQIQLDRLPKSSVLLKQDKTLQDQFAACGGDDYELCFTAPADQRETIARISKQLALSLTRIGTLQALKHNKPTIQLLRDDGSILDDTQSTKLLKSFDHFA